MQNKKQHYIPQSYLKMWCDPNTPEGYEPYVWKFSKDGSKKDKKAPKKIFYEKEMYTLFDKENNRDLKLENGLHTLEDLFCRTRDNIILKDKEIDSESKFIICAFMASMHARTASRRDFLKKQWQHILDEGNKFKEAYLKATDDQKQAMIRSQHTIHDGPTISHKDVEELAKNPLKKNLFTQIEVEAPLIYELDMAIIRTDAKPGFITSDNPCFWNDPEAYKRPPILRAPALIYPSIEIIMPISPNYLVLLNRKKHTGYIDLQPFLSNDFNRMIRIYCNENFIVNRDFVNKYWFSEKPIQKNN